MATINQLIANAEALNLRSALQDAIQASSDALVRLQRLQMLQGIKASGKKIGRYKSRDYAVRKALQNPLAGTGNVDLRLTGAFYGNTFVDIRDNSIVFDSADPKTERLMTMYGDPFGLTRSNAAEVNRSHIMPKLATIAKQQILK